MNDRTRFAKGMLALSLSLKMYGRELTGPMQEVYWTALGDLSDDEFEHAAAVLLRRETDFPPPALFLEVARPTVNRLAEAHGVMCKALLLTDYDPEGGTTWRAPRIREEIGEAAYQAFLACGGAPGFRDYDSPFHGARVRREFCEVYSGTVANDPQTALPAPKRVALPAAFTELMGGIGREVPRLPKPEWATHIEPVGETRPEFTPEQLETKRAGYRELAEQARAAKVHLTPLEEPPSP